MLNDLLRNNYTHLWRTVKVLPEHQEEVYKIADYAFNQKHIYTQISNATKVKDIQIPWKVIACIHSLESNFNFDTHLHNGDSLKRRTVNVPKGRPTNNSPPFTWVYSAIDALKMKEHVYKDFKEWDTPNTLFFLERYNGLGYLKYHKDVNSPYIWSYTNHYTKGKYSSDGKFDSGLVSRQAGAGAILKGIEILAR